jgi:hypothetical protein
MNRQERIERREKRASISATCRKQIFDAIIEELK